MAIINHLAGGLHVTGGMTLPSSEDDGAARPLTAGPGVGVMATYWDYIPNGDVVGVGPMVRGKILFGQPCSPDFTGSVGGRVSYIQSGLVGVTAALEGGYEFHSNGDDHPYLGLEIGGQAFGLGPAIGVAIDPVSVANGRPGDNGGIYAGLKFGF